MQDGFLSIDLQKGVCAWLWFHMERFFFRPATACRLSIYFVLFPPHRISEVNKKRWPLIRNTLGMNLLNNYSFTKTHMKPEHHPRNQRDIHLSNHSNPPLLVSISWLLFFLEYVLLISWYLLIFFGFSESGVVRPRNFGTVGWEPLRKDGELPYGLGKLPQTARET